MLNFLRNGGRPRLLVSVRNVDEAQAALAGGADIIDVKEPDRGSLGAAERETITAIVRAVGDSAPVSAALGELVDLLECRGHPTEPLVPAGVAYFKVGLANCGALANWRIHWNDLAKSARGARQVAVAYADWQSARAPSPEEVLTAAAASHCPAVLVDTWDKAGGTLLDQWPAERLEAFVRRVQSHGVAVVLAGSLSIAALRVAGGMRLDVLAVRAAACEGGRNGRVSRSRVAALRQAIDAASAIGAG